MNKKVLILGGSSDIGIEVIKKFLKDKWIVVAHYSKNSHELKKIKNKNLKIFKYDLRDIYNFEKFLNKNSLLNNINSYISLTGYINSVNFSNIKITDFYDHINVNYLSNLLVLKKILPQMKKNNFGRVLLSSSTGVKFGGGETTPLYSLTKYMNEFFFSTYNELSKKNILINTIRIGLTKTKIHKKIKKNLAKRIQMIPIKRMASTKEVANYIFIYSTGFNTLTTKKIIDVTGGE